MEKLISIATVLATMTVSSDNLPWILKKVRHAQIQLILDSQASRWWPKAMTLPSR
jgi:hypothetical protein